MTNLERFFSIHNQLPREQREAFENYFVGSLSILAPQKAWEDALTTATAMVERIHAVAVDRKELECPRCEAWPCICGDVDFETFNNEQWDSAEREGRD